MRKISHGDFAKFLLFFVFMFWVSIVQSSTAKTLELEAKARSGDADAAYELGLGYSSPGSSSVDFDLAGYWFYRASIGGSSKAQYAMSLLLNQGWGLPQNPKEALHWLERAAQSGLNSAQLRLAETLESGKNTPRKLAQSIQWYTEAAEQGNPEARFQLSQLLELGEGLPKDLDASLRLCRMAALDGYAKAQYRLSQLYFKRLDDPRNFDRGLQWLRKAAESKHIQAQIHLAGFYRQGIGIKQSYDLAVKWLESASRQGDSRAAYELGSLILEQGPQSDESVREAYGWLEKSSKGGYAYASIKISEMYTHGNQILKNPVLANLWYQKGRSQEEVSPSAKPVGSNPDITKLSKRLRRKWLKSPTKLSLRTPDPLKNPPPPASTVKHLKTRSVRAQATKLMGLLSKLKSQGGPFALQAFKNQCWLAKTCFLAGQDDLALRLLNSLTPEVKAYIDQLSSVLASRLKLPSTGITPTQMRAIHDSWNGDLSIYRNQMLTALRTMLMIANTYAQSGRYRQALRVARACCSDQDTRLHSVFWEGDHFLNQLSRSLLGRPLESGTFYDEFQNTLAFIEEANG
jgi:TPR repeat protein